jgi:hypothetical protein
MTATVCIAPKSMFGSRYILVVAQADKKKGTKNNEIFKRLKGFSITDRTPPSRNS